MALLTANVRSCPWAGRKKTYPLLSAEKINWNITLVMLVRSVYTYCLLYFPSLTGLNTGKWMEYMHAYVCVYMGTRCMLRTTFVRHPCAPAAAAAPRLLSWAEWKRDEPATPSALFNALPSDRRPASCAPLPHRFGKERRRGSQKAHITTTTKTTWTNNARPQLRTAFIYRTQTPIYPCCVVVRRHFGSWQKKKAFVALLREYSFSKENYTILYIPTWIQNFIKKIPRYWARDDVLAAGCLMRTRNTLTS